MLRRVHTLSLQLLSCRPPSFPLTLRPFSSVSNASTSSTPDVVVLSLSPPLPSSSSFFSSLPTPTVVVSNKQSFSTIQRNQKLTKLDASAKYRGSADGTAITAAADAAKASANAWQQEPAPEPVKTAGKYKLLIVLLALFPLGFCAQFVIDEKANKKAWDYRKSWADNLKFK